MVGFDMWLSPLLLPVVLLSNIAHVLAAKTAAAGCSLTFERRTGRSGKQGRCSQDAGFFFQIRDPYDGPLALEHLCYQHLVQARRMEEELEAQRRKAYSYIDKAMGRN